jgi:deoxyribose-phosphate aldolase
MPNNRQLITANDVRRAHGSLALSPNAIVTPSARDLAESLGVQLIPSAVLEGKATEQVSESKPVPAPAVAPGELAACIDHTNLSPEATAEDIARLCDEAIQYGFASVCILPVRIASAAQHVRGEAPAVCGVVGFPSGGHDSATKAHEASFCVRSGACEIDMVANAGLLRDGNIDAYHAEIRDVRSAIGADRILKVIVEAPLLEPADLVRAAVVAANAGADFVKTSTGVYAKAREEDVTLLRRALPPNIRIKAAGGICTAPRALAFLSLGADRIGTSSSVQIVEELKR